MKVWVQERLRKDTLGLVTLLNKFSGTRNRTRGKGRYTSDPYFILRLLVWIASSKRPSQIANKMGMTPQALNPYIKKLKESGLIIKSGNRKGIGFSLTSKGKFLLKNLLRPYVGAPPGGIVPMRLHNIQFSFQIQHIPAGLNLRWTELRNGVKKAGPIPIGEAKADIVLSPNKGKSVVLINMPETYTFRDYSEIVALYDRARIAAQDIADRLSLKVATTGTLTKRPHFAFETDLLAYILADRQTASKEIENGDGMAWIDSSNGYSELETDSPLYTDLYLQMPLLVAHIEQLSESTNVFVGTYLRHFHPLQSINN
jgi:DNA-binding MarR family transcriptional regulator